MSPQPLAAVTGLTGVDAVSARRLDGGSVGSVFAVELADGRVTVAKTHTNHAPGATAAEAAGLGWLAEPGVVRVPAVLGHDERWLVVEHVTAGPPSQRAAERLGRGLARLHAAGAPAHGAPPPGGPSDAWIGMAPMRNEPAPGWPEFYVSHRVRPYLRAAVDAGTLSAEEGRRVASVEDHITEIAGPAEPPARLHGDLWGGNVLWGADTGAGGTAWLLDPAAHGGHRETDLAMLHLFGCPHLDRVLAAYQEVAPLAAGWRDRIALHQLFPLLVHTVLFGRSYVGRTLAAADRALAVG